MEKQAKWEGPGRAEEKAVRGLSVTLARTGSCRPSQQRLPIPSLSPLVLGVISEVRTGLLGGGDIAEPQGPSWTCSAWHMLDSAGLLGL